MAELVHLVSDYLDGQTVRPASLIVGSPVGQPHVPTGAAAPRHVCQVTGCGADLGPLKDFYKRYRICGYHAQVEHLVAGDTKVRFCQLCGRFQSIAEFDGVLRSCRDQLFRHRTRRAQKKAERRSNREKQNKLGVTQSLKPSAGGLVSAEAQEHLRALNASATSPSPANSKSSHDGEATTAPWGQESVDIEQQFSRVRCCTSPNSAGDRPLRLTVSAPLTVMQSVGDSGQASPAGSGSNAAVQASASNQQAIDAYVQEAYQEFSNADVFALEADALQSWQRNTFVAGSMDGRVAAPLRVSSCSPVLSGAAYRRASSPPLLLHAATMPAGFDVFGADTLDSPGRLPGEAFPPPAWAGGRSHASAFSVRAVPYLDEVIGQEIGTHAAQAATRLGSPVQVEAAVSPGDAYCVEQARQPRLGYAELAHNLQAAEFAGGRMVPASETAFGHAQSNTSRQGDMHYGRSTLWGTDSARNDTRSRSWDGTSPADFGFENIYVHMTGPY